LHSPTTQAWCAAADLPSLGCAPGAHLLRPLGTRTDFNQNQQDGIAVAIAKESWRMEVMAILGNYSLRRRVPRARTVGIPGGVSFSRLALGVSALVTAPDAGLGSEGPTLRQAYG